MIITEEVRYIKHYSDKNVMLRQVETGNLYGEPLDIYPCPYTYEETDIVIDKGEDVTNTEESQDT